MLTEKEIERWDRAVALVERAVRQLNEALGYAEGDKHRVTFGYIGNCEPLHCALGSKGDTRLWSVYLPHPDRVGTSDDRIGSVASGDADGMAAVAGQVLAFRAGVAFVGAAGRRSSSSVSQHDLVVIRNADARYAAATKAQAAAERAAL